MTLRGNKHSVATLCLTLAVAGSALLAGCSASSVADNLPGDMGLPAGTPARPTATMQYPAVHDMPPPRPLEPLSEEEQARMERELIRARDMQEGRTRDVKKKPNTAPAKPGAKPPAAAGEPAGSGRNP